MTNENDEAIKNLKKLRSFHNGSYAPALDKAIESLKNEKRFIHVIIHHPNGERDGWLDKSRQLLFTDAATTEFAKRVFGWSWEED